MSDRAAALLAWYRRHRRKLPWRDACDPWAILVGEVMLQQTQAARVAARYVEFLERFPTPAAMARAPVRVVLAAWSGLGYNRRVLRLQEAARHIEERGWPEDVEGLRRLPGVGTYTGAAVACFGFGAQVAAVDTNHRRVLSRWYGRPLAAAELAATAAAELPEAEAAAWNQAVMDLGSLLCRPASPRCDECPVKTSCGDPTVYSAPARQPRFEGSVRQARGAIVRALTKQPSIAPEALTVEGVDRATLARAIHALESEGLIVSIDGLIEFRDARRGSYQIEST